MGTVTDSERNAPSFEPVQLTAPRIDDDGAQRLRNFHATHFLGQPLPEVRTTDRPASHTRIHDLRTVSEEEEEAVEDLGCYPDGVRRTLTDDQIRMFRHSEIQRLLLEREQKREKEEQEAERRARRQARDIAQQRHFSDAPQGNDVNMLVYDDEEPSTKETQGPREFMWPKLGT